MNRLEGKVALISGTAQSQGRAAACASQPGADLVVDGGRPTVLPGAITQKESRT
ncbi:hypothetical protein OG596_25805 [Streptomyces sp. NBC_01102]|uniref:hypothetical protein n=1 Tax=unclassified Streptomyces TaxID=2593676 RepID=UPI00386DD0AF|nr:hypothetical protein OG596_25805 [Streptomyces sp. NBC_01102]